MIRQTLQANMWWRLTTTLGIGLLVISCSFAKTYPTPRDALAEFPGHLTNSEIYLEGSVRFLQEQEVAGGRVLLYSWKSPKSQTEGTQCIAATFVAPVVTLRGKGWRAQSSGTIGFSHQSLECNWTFA